MKKKVLGKGLEALIPRSHEGRREYETIALANIRQNPNQPRKKFESGALGELVHSIKAKGVIQPILVRKVATGYELIAGERRLRAAREAGLEMIPAVVKNATEGEALEMAIIENVQREDLNPMEVAEAYAALQNEFGLSQEEIAKKVGKERSTVANYMRLLKLPREIREGMVKERITMGHAKALLSLPSDALMREFYRTIVGRSLSVRQAETISRSLINKKGISLEKKEKNHIPVEVKDLLLGLQKMLGARVALRGSVNKGILEIHYASQDELDGIVRKIKG